VSFDVGPSNLSPETEEILRRAREGERMPSAHKRRLKGAVLARIAFTGTATLAAGQATAKVGGFSLASSLAAKTVVGVAILGSLGAGGYLALRPARQPAPAVTRPALAPRVEAPPVEVVVEEPVAIEATVPAPAPRHRPAVRRAPPPPPPPAADLAEETRLLRDADKALRAGSTAKAIALLDEHAARFPKGALAPERAAERLIVSCELGVADRGRVDQFLASRGASPLAARVRRACAPK
jgi:hypothetical protein